MNNLTPFQFKDSTLSMSSTEIAFLTGKRHSDVLESIRKVLNEVNIDSAEFSAQYKDTSGRSLPCFNLPRRECDLVIAGFSAKYRLAIIDRWQELEQKNSVALPQTYAAALRALADETEAKQVAQAQIEADKPKVKFAEVVAESSNTRCIRVWVKAMKHENNLTVGERQVFKWLVDNRYIYRDRFGYLPKSDYEANRANYFTLVIDDINGKPRRQLKITGKGVVALTEKVVGHFSQIEKVA